MDKSTELNGADAAEYIDTLDTAEEVRAFIEGDTRKGVQSAAEKRIAAIYPKEQEIKSDAPGGTDVQSEAEKRIASHDTWMYSKEEAPKIFRAGEEIPAGWQESPKGIVPDIWKQEISGKWVK